LHYYLNKKLIKFFLHVFIFIKTIKIGVKIKKKSLFIITHITKMNIDLFALKIVKTKMSDENYR